MQQNNFITKCDNLLLQSASGITKCDRILLESASGITKCDRLYYKIQILKSVTVITKRDVTYCLNTTECEFTKFNIGIVNAILTKFL